MFLLALSVFLPPLGIMLLAAADLVYSKLSVETLARSYVENFTESIARTIESSVAEPRPTEIGPYENHDIKLGPHTYLGLGRTPALLAVLDRNGVPLYSSEALLDLLEFSDGDFPMGSAKEMYDDEGELFTVAIYPSASGNFSVVGAMSWKELPGFTTRALYLWPLLMGCAGLWSAMSVWNLWRRVIIPLGELEREVSSLKWGEEAPSYEFRLGRFGALTELIQLRKTLSNVGREAIKTVSIIRTCMNDIVRVQEDERAKISRDIHDGPLQDVTALIQRIHLARLPDNTPEDAKRELDLAEKIAQATVKEMRALCDFLNPPWLELGLDQALTELTERQSVQYGVRIFLDIDEYIDLSEPVTLAFFRVVQEAVTNSVKHGEAKNVWVDVKHNEHGIELCVQDDGHGFDMLEGGTADLRAEGHRGLSNMEERLELVGGRLKIISYPGEGTCVRGLIP
jgi:signal transduction histidine kinase